MIMTAIFILFAQVTDVQAIKETTDFLVTKDLKWWLIALVVVGVLFVGTIFRWLFASHVRTQEGLEKQLSDQRSATAEKDKALLEYLREDRAKVIEVLHANTTAARELSNSNRMLTVALNRILPGSIHPTEPGN